jgi:glycine hydroxymethyltransferase
LTGRKAASFWSETDPTAGKKDLQLRLYQAPRSAGELAIKPDGVIFVEGKEFVSQILSLVDQSQRFRSHGLNMNCSENATSCLVRRVLASDAARRISYTGPVKLYGGTNYLDKALDICAHLAEKLFGADHASLWPLTGAVAVASVLFAFAGPGDRVMTIHPSNGGWPNLLFAKRWFDARYFRNDRSAIGISLEKAVEDIYKYRPNIIMLGATIILFPAPIRELAKAAEEVGAVIFYDGVQDLGLIAGGQFQDPLREGCPIMAGGTNKSFPGPHRGIILTKGDEAFERIERVSGQAPFDPFVQSSYDLAAAIAVGISLAEMLEYGRDYAKQVVSNCKALGRALHDGGIDIAYSEKDFTESHMILQRVGKTLPVSAEGHVVKEKLEEANIFVDAVPRYSTNELTRLGMKETEMKEVARLVRRVLLDNADPKKVAVEVSDLASQFQTLKYCFDEDDEAYKYFSFL